MPTIDQGTISVLTYKDGLLSRLGHDLRLTLERFEIEIDGDRVAGRFWPDSLQIAGAVRDGQLSPGELSQKDRRDIQGNIAKVLQTKRHPEVRFDGRVEQSAAGPSAAKRLEVSGTLRMVGRQADLTIEVHRDDGKLSGQLTLTPTRWGIQPFKALLGALRIQDRVDLEFELADPT